MTTQEITVTSRARNLGFAFSTVPTGNGTQITKPTRPSVVGGLRTVEAEMERMGRVVNGGTFYRAVWFVGGREVTEGGRDMVYFLREHGKATVRVQAPPQ